MSTYESDDEALYRWARRFPKAPGLPSMIYDRPPTYAAIRRANRLLARHNLVFRAYGRSKFWRTRGRVTVRDENLPVPRGWLSIADEIVCGVAGGGARP